MCLFLPCPRTDSRPFLMLNCLEFELILEKICLTTGIGTIWKRKHQTINVCVKYFFQFLSMEYYLSPDHWGSDVKKLNQTGGNVYFM